MLIRWMFAASHLLGLGIGLGAIWARARSLQAPLDGPGLRRVLAADSWWGIAALIWIGTGLVRLLANLEKSTSYYMSNPVFWGKMAAVILIVVLEIGPMATLIRWRIRIGRGEAPDTSLAPRFAVISFMQAGLVVLAVLAAAAMARGIGMRLA